MGRSWKIAGLGLFAVLIVMQFFQPETNDAPLIPEQDMLSLISPDEDIAILVRNACYNCHSNQTVYPWYSRVAPVSWYLDKHIRDGKAELNFSDYGELDKADKIGMFADFCDVLDAGTMPLRSYMMIHANARLSDEQRVLLCEWTEAEALKVMRD
jgi:hypothetical protein